MLFEAVASTAQTEVDPSWSAQKPTVRLPAGVHARSHVLAVLTEPKVVACHRGWGRESEAVSEQHGLSDIVPTPSAKYEEQAQRNHVSAMYMTQARVSVQHRGS